MISRFPNSIKGFLSYGNVSRKQGFTLVEMLAVVTIIVILAGASVSGIRQARNVARNAKAESEARELVNAWLQYFNLRGEWPSGIANQSKVESTYKNLKPITEPSSETKGIVLFNLTERTDGKNTMLDPWGNPYILNFKPKKDSSEHKSSLYSCVAFPFKNVKKP